MTRCTFSRGFVNKLFTKELRIRVFSGTYERIVWSDTGYSVFRTRINLCMEHNPNFLELFGSDINKYRIWFSVFFNQSHPVLVVYLFVHLEKSREFVFERAWRVWIRIKFGLNYLIIMMWNQLKSIRCNVRHLGHLGIHIWNFISEFS